jgi:hypothetical protein
VLRVERPGDGQRDDARLGRSRGTEGVELLDRARRDDLTAPLLLAAVSPCAEMAARTSSASPPMTAAMLVGVTADAAAIARPRSRTRTIACSAEMTWAPTAAVISPTL